METPDGRAVVAREGDSVEMACVGAGLPIPRYE